MFNDAINPGIEIHSENSALFLWRLGLIVDNLDIFCKGERVVLIDQMEIVVLFKYSLHFDKATAGDLFENLVFLTVQSYLLFIEVLLEYKDKSILCFLLQTERITVVKTMDHFYHSLYYQVRKYYRVSDK